MKKLDDSCQSGRSMVEILGVLAIIGVLSVGGIAGYTKAMEKLNINNILEDVNTIIQNIHTSYAGQANYLNLDNAIAIDTAIVPIHMAKDRTIIKTRLGGDVVIKSIAQGAGYVLIINEMTRAPCMALATADWGNGDSAPAIFIISQTGVIPPRGFPTNLESGEFTTKDLPLTPVDASPFCQCNVEFGCGIAWFYRK